MSDRDVRGGVRPDWGAGLGAVVRALASHPSVSVSASNVLALLRTFFFEFFSLRRANISKFQIDLDIKDLHENYVRLMRFSCLDDMN